MGNVIRIGSGVWVNGVELEKVTKLDMSTNDDMTLDVTVSFVADVVDESHFHTTVSMNHNGRVFELGELSGFRKLNPHEAMGMMSVDGASLDDYNELLGERVGLWFNEATEYIEAVVHSVSTPQLERVRLTVGSLNDDPYLIDKWGKREYFNDK